MTYKKLYACALLASIGATTATYAAFDLAAVQVGGFFSDGSVDNDPTDQNYYVGYSTSSSIAERRNFFVFDTSGLTTDISAASLSLTLFDGGLIFGVDTPGIPPIFDATEDFILSGTPATSLEILEPMIDAPSAIGIWDTFGDPSEGIGAIGFAADEPVPIPPEGLEIVIDLTAAGVMLINDSLLGNGGSGEVILTGRMLDVSILIPEPEMDELMFGFTDVIKDGLPATTDMPFLSLTEVPESSSAAWLMGLVATAAILNRRKR